MPVDPSRALRDVTFSICKRMNAAWAPPNELEDERLTAWYKDKKYFVTFVSTDPEKIALIDEDTILLNVEQHLFPIIKDHDAQEMHVISGIFTAIESQDPKHYQDIASHQNAVNNALAQFYST